MKLLSRLLASSPGRKYVMAASGAGLLVFVTVHMLGNLQVLLGPEVLNAYAHSLRNPLELLWAIRLVLIGLVVMHLWACVALTLENRAARPVAYARSFESPAVTYASRTMMWSGGVAGLFVVYHLLHFTVKAPGVNLTGLDFGVWTHTLPDGRGTPDVYRMVIAGFSRPVVAVFYVASVGLLCWHLSHGIGAAFQSLGCKNRAWAVAIRLLSNGYALMLFLGFVAVPVAVALGFGKEALK
ncbi:MAG TPA: succinate dehydrogenase cytochrome b subunit [Verrucomicrobiota bacterium]|nr:succinate dehydrogenase cytochrome b subunit [Verrucomicrobiota bacterium]HNU49797.1 succinate dehydrogenase cytochrome b subunit [Verrucomicrobiota bacterium]